MKGSVLLESCYLLLPNSEYIQIPTRLIWSVSNKDIWSALRISWIYAPINHLSQTFIKDTQKMQRRQPAEDAQKFQDNLSPRLQIVFSRNLNLSSGAGGRRPGHL